MAWRDPVDGCLIRPRMLVGIGSLLLLRHSGWMKRNRFEVVGAGSSVLSSRSPRVRRRRRRWNKQKTRAETKRATAMTLTMMPASAPGERPEEADDDDESESSGLDSPKLTGIVEAGTTVAEFRSRLEGTGTGAIVCMFGGVVAVTKSEPGSGSDFVPPMVGVTCGDAAPVAAWPVGDLVDGGTDDGGLISVVSAGTAAIEMTDRAVGVGADCKGESGVVKVDKVDSGKGKPSVMMETGPNQSGAIKPVLVSLGMAWIDAEGSAAGGAAVIEAAEQACATDRDAVEVGADSQEA